MSMASRAVRQRAIAEMFKDVERRWGNLDKLLRPDLQVERCAALSTQSLRRLFSLETLALVIPNFVQARRRSPTYTGSGRGGAELVRDLGARHGVLGRAGRGRHAPQYGRIAMILKGTLMKMCQGEKLVESLPGGDALDRLRCDLDDAWPGGCSSKKECGGRARTTSG